MWLLPEPGGWASQGEEPAEEKDGPNWGQLSPSATEDEEPGPDMSRSAFRFSDTTPAARRPHCDIRPVARKLSLAHSSPSQRRRRLLRRRSSGASEVSAVWTARPARVGSDGLTHITIDWLSEIIHDEQPSSRRHWAEPAQQ